ncbi:MAG: hypothetical protein AMJ79_12990 [Phycisphaerae bacterium SM23_30]|nr:MAG: hypothetical protein AMJ79_12990 [Phycisphaerae bacterium SM23_30]
MMVKVKLFASLQGLYPEHRIGRPMPLDLPDSATLARLLEHLKLPDTKIIFVNGIARTDLQMPLGDGDEIGIFPLVGGG